MKKLITWGFSVWHTEATWRSFCAEQTMAWLVESVESDDDNKGTRKGRKESPQKDVKDVKVHLAHLSPTWVSSPFELEKTRRQDASVRIIQNHTGINFPREQFGLRLCRVWWLVAQQRAAFASRRGTTERCLQRIGIGMGCLQHDAGVLSQAGEGVSGSQTAREFYSLTMWMCSVKKVSCLTKYFESYTQQSSATEEQGELTCKSHFLYINSSTILTER